jgi:Ti-type conjugative transfer relaxase TraA
MIAVGKVGGGLSGCVRYVMGEGRDPDSKQLRPAAANDESRVAWISGQGFGVWTPQTRADVETMRRMMEFDARPENQISQTRKCEKDVLHLILSWRTGETPTRDEMEQAAKEALAAVGMEKARAVFVAHSDTPHAHLHIVASRIDPETGRAFRDSYTNYKWQKWALEWEREHGNVQCLKREQRSQLQAAIAERNAAAVLDLMTQRQATFTGKELDYQLGGVLGKEEAASFKAELLAQADVLALHDRESGARLDRFTTRGVRSAEAKALEHAAALAADRRHQVGKKAAAAALAKRPTMRDEQRRAFAHATGAEGLAVIDGKAGTGKSYTMAAIRDAYEGDGKRVIGLAPTNAVAQDMQRDGFTEAKTVHAALFALKNGRDKWNKKTVLMVDEAAMIGTKIMAELLARAHEAGAKLIFVGDDRQLASIERGGLFTELRERFGAATLSEVTRQKNAEHKAAAEMLSRGEFAEAVDALDKLGCINRSNHQTEALAALVAQWKADTATAPEKSRLVFAYINDDVQQLNAALRAVRKERGELGDDHEFKTKDGKANFATQDKILFRTTDKRKGISNGAIGTIEAIDGTNITVRLDESKKRLTFDAAEFQAFRHAYAATIYKGQGRTLDDVYLFHTRHWKAAATYVALTRHRDDVKLFVSTELTRDNADLARQLARHDDRRASLAYATTEEAREQRRDQHQRAAPPSPLCGYGAAGEEVTGHKAEPYHEPPPKAPEPEPPPPAPTHEPPKEQQQQQEAKAAATEKLAQLVAEMEGDDPTPVRPSERAREVRATVQGTAPPAPTAHIAPSPDAATGRQTPAPDPQRPAAHVPTSEPSATPTAPKQPEAAITSPPQAERRGFFAVAWQRVTAFFQQGTERDEAPPHPVETPQTAKQREAPSLIPYGRAAQPEQRDKAAEPIRDASRTVTMGADTPRETTVFERAVRLAAERRAEAERREHQATAPSADARAAAQRGTTFERARDRQRGELAEERAERRTADRDKGERLRQRESRREREMQEEQQKRFEAMMEAAKRENEKDQEIAQEQGRERERGGGHSR